METHFKSTHQERLFRSVLREMRGIGYTKALLKTDYEFVDYFSNNSVALRAPAVGFGQYPHDYASSCFVVALANGRSGASLISQFRSLGAPLLFEVKDDHVVQWKVTSAPSVDDVRGKILANELPTVFRENAHVWKPLSILRSKGLGVPQDRQLDFIDSGLIPALEQHVRSKLDPLLKALLHDAKSGYEERHGEVPDFDSLVRLVFRVLTSKAMRDKGVEPFASLSANPSSSELLDAIATHYADSQPMLRDPDTQRFVIESLWGGMSFANLSVETLAFTWENTLVDDALRDARGIHSTPPAVAHYVANRLIDSVPGDGQCIVEPCCGAGTFLVAAMHRMRTLLPETMTPRVRHARFVRWLHGFDTESFGLEMAHACLTLADFPNPNGWSLRNVDVFESESEARDLHEALAKAKFVLCNPPFEDFTEEQQDQYSVEYIQKPAAILDVVLKHIPEYGEIGFVLPYSAISGRSYSELRRKIADRFSQLEMVYLPEGVFEIAKFPTVVIIGKGPIHHDTVSVRYSHVSDAKDFLTTGNVAWTETNVRTKEDCRNTLAVRELQSLWDFLSNSSIKLGEVSEDIARGVEWEGFDREQHVSSTPKKGFVPGFDTVDGMACFEPPPIAYLCNRKEIRRRNAWDKNWRIPKVVCNAVRRSLSAWRLCACSVELNLLCTPNFTVIWPRSPWTTRSISAILNGPVASAFATCHEHWKHIKKSTFENIPVPSFTPSQIATLDEMVAEYEGLVSMRRGNFCLGGLFGTEYPSEPLLQEKLRAIDRFVIDAYGIPARLNTELVKFCGNGKRPVPFPYTIDNVFAKPRSRTNELIHKEEAAALAALSETLRDNRM